MKKYILCETIERDISNPEFFDNKKEAVSKMKKAIKSVCGPDDEYGIESMSAWANSDGGDTNCDWRIFEVEM